MVLFHNTAFLLLAYTRLYSPRFWLFSITIEYHLNVRGVVFVKRPKTGFEFGFEGVSLKTHR